MNTIVFVVSPHRRELFDALTAAFEKDDGVRVVEDRRTGPRRHASATAPERERRRYDRREHHMADVDLRERGWAVVQLRG